MSKNNGKQLKPIENESPIVASDIPDHRRCPICWGTRQGIGCVYDSRKPFDAGQDDWPPNVRRRYYRCVKTLNHEWGPCGHTWVVIVEASETVVQKRPAMEIETR